MFLPVVETRVAGTVAGTPPPWRTFCIHTTTRTPFDRINIRNKMCTQLTARPRRFPWYSANRYEPLFWVAASFDARGSTPRSFVQTGRAQRTCTAPQIFHVRVALDLFANLVLVFATTCVAQQVPTRIKTCFSTGCTSPCFSALTRCTRTDHRPARRQG